MLGLLGGGVILLLPLFGTTTQAEHQVKGGLLLDVVVRQGAAIFQLLASKDQPLLIGGNSLLILDLGLAFSMVSEASTSRVMVLPVRVFTKICMVCSSVSSQIYRKQKSTPCRSS